MWVCSSADHLQAVLDRAQEQVGGFEIARRLGADPAALGERREHRQRLAAAQRRIAAAGDQLLRLHEELDLADAAAAELDVVALDRDLVVAAVGVDLPLHRMHVGDRGEVEILAPDERRDLASGRPRRAAISPAHGRALIIAARSQFWPTRLVVGERGVGRDRDLGRGGIGPQPQVDAEHVAVGGALLQELHQAARQAQVERRRLDVAARAPRRRGSNSTMRSMSLE